MLYRVKSNLILAIIVLVIIVSSSPILGTAQDNIGLEPLVIEPTRVYGAYEAFLPSGAKIIHARYDPSRNLIIATGKDFLALVQPASPPLLVWSETVIGEPTVLELDKVSNPRWMVIGTSTGEITALNLDNLGERMDYYTSEGVPIESAYIADHDNNRYIMALNERGYLYLYRVSEPYWGVIGPDPGDGPLKDMEGYEVAWFTPLFVKSSWNRGYWDPTRVMASLREYPEEILSAIEAYLYYKERGTGVEKPIIPGESQVENTTLREVRKLLYVLTAYPYGSLYSHGEITGNATSNFISIGGLPPVAFNFNVFYTITRIDTSLNVTVSSECYYGSKTVSLESGKTTFIQKMVATYLAPTLEACLSEAGINLKDGETIGFNNFLAIDSTPIPYRLQLGDNVKLVVIPASEGVQLSTSSVFTLIKPNTIPDNWPRGGYALFAIAVKNELYIYILDSNLNVLSIPGIGKPFERISLEADATSIELSPDGSRLYVGTSSGRLILLEWLASEGRYVEKHSIQVSSVPVISIIELRGGDYVAAAAHDGSLQLININEWKPWWRGVPVFPSINLGFGLSSMFHINGVSLFAVTQEGGLLIFNHNMEPYVPLVGTVKVLVKRLDGSLDAFNGYNYHLEALSDSIIMAREKISDGEAVLYVPEGQITLGVYIDGLGRAVFPSITAKYPLTTFTSTILLREVEIHVYTPDKGGSKTEDPGYKLVAGPKSGVNITLIPEGQEGGLGYSILGETINTSTGGDGSVNVVLWDGLEYSGTAELEGFKQSVFEIQALDPSSLNVELHPILYTITLEALDGEALASGIIYRAPETVFSVGILEYGTRVDILASGGRVSVGLPRGTYIITASSPYYDNSTIEGVVIPGSNNIRFTLNPKYYNVSIDVVLKDELYGLASGPLPRAMLKITLVNPPLGYTFEAQSATPLILRFGEYKVEVRDKLVGEETFDIVIRSHGSYILTVSPIYSDVRLELYDSEVENTYLPRATLEIEYMTDFWSNTITLDINKVPYNIKLPYGNYTITVSSFGYKDTRINTTINEPSVVIKEKIEPRKIRITINAVFRDELTGVAKGGVPSTQIEARLLNPNVTKAPVQLITGPNGSVVAVMRVGVYIITADSTYTEKTVVSLRIDSPGVYTIEMKPIYSNLTVEVVDDETPVTIPGITIHIKRTGPGLPSTLTVTSDDGIESLILPVGSYVFSASIPSRYTSNQYTIDLSPKDLYTRLTIEATPIRVSAEILVQSLNAYVKYKDRIDLLPPGPIPNATITLIPSDPLLDRVGAKSIVAYSDSKGIARFNDIRTGTYLILVQADGYIASAASASILTEGQRLSVGLTPLIHEVSLIIMDPELIPELSVLEHANVTIIAYNNVSSSVTIEYSIGEPIEMATGSYTLILSSSGYIDTLAMITVFRDASYNLTITPLKYNVTIELLSTTEFGTLPVTSGLISVKAVNLDLINPVISAPVKDGVVVLKLRAGLYEVVYNEPSIGYQIGLGTFNITRDATISRSIEAPTVTLELVLLDSEFDVPVNASSISLEYLGPFGSGTKSIDVKGSIAVTTVPAGTVRVVASASGYIDFRDQFNVSSDSSLEIRLIPFKVDVIFTIINPDDEQVTDINVKVLFKHNILPYTVEGVASKGILLLKSVRIGGYTVQLIPPPDSPYSNTTINVKILPDGAVEPDVLILNYKVYNVTVKLLDRETGTPIKVPYKVTLVRAGKGSEKLGFPLSVEVIGEANISVPLGSYRVEIAPVDKEYYLAPTSTISFKVPDTLNVVITLTAKQFPVSILVVDDRGDPVPAAFVRIVGGGGVVIDAGYTDVTGTFASQLKFGTYSVEVEKPGYSKSTIPFSVPQSSTVTVELAPGPMILVRRFLPLIIGVGGLITLAGTLYIMRERISRRILEEEEYF
ncbi:MAG: carboxypeptidase regulatory-like domain-containing protein [Desulfurococcales archaeon]|nr:carboxypeptidase regulatory-like domain-containing protein [Desulfurococcales archaeon]